MARPTRPLLEPIDWALLRAPLLPVEAYPDGAVDDSGSPALLPKDPRVRAALAVGTDYLFTALQRTRGSAPEAPRLRGKLLRYLIRMTTRPTPYGLFAGVGLVEWESTTDAALTVRPLRTRARLDMGWLLDRVMELERDPRVRRQLRLFANALALSKAGRVFLSERAGGWEHGDPAALGVSVRATAAVQRVLAMARTPVGYAELATGLHSIPGATPAKIDKLIEELWQQSFLLTDLRPPLTGINPGRYVCDRLRTVDGTRRVQEGLLALLHSLERWDALAVEERADGWTALTEQAATLRPASASTASVQVDMALPLADAHVHPDVAKEAARAAELLLRMSPYPAGPPALHAYRARFEERYGPDREVPLLELLDPDFGLGPPGEKDDARDPLELARREMRWRTLRDLALEALRERRRVVELDDQMLSRLETSPLAPDTAPRSLEVCISVAATSPAAIDAGDFTVIVGSNLGADSAGRNLGRFADLLGAKAHKALQEAAGREDGGAGWVRAELVYLPQQARLANIAVRPAVARREIVCGTSPSGPPDRVIPLDELVVGVRGGRFYVRWPAAEADIAVSAMHMLHPLYAPLAFRFLQDVERDGRVVFRPFDWGPATEFPFLPRVQHERVVLSLAQWRVEGLSELRVAPSAFQDALRAWRERWSAPRHVYLAEADNRLLLDLENPAHCEVLREELRRKPTGQARFIQEALPGLEHAWLPGPDGRHIVELVVPLVARVRPVRRAEKAAPLRVASSTTPFVRMRPPGSDWLFLKLYCPPALQDELIAEELTAFTTFAESTALAHDWFFVRYADPDAHLRVRFQGEPDVILHRLLPRACSWATSLTVDGSCLRFGFDTYEREIERYGGATGVEVAEELFAADSRAVAKLLRLKQDLPTLDRTTLAVLSVDTLLDGLGLSCADRLAWYQERVSLSRADGQEYRLRQRLLRQLLANGPAAEPGGDALAGLLDDYRRASQPVAARLDALAREGRLGRAKASLCESYVHMHCNRLLGTEADEERVLRFARRTRESLSRAPAT